MKNLVTRTITGFLYGLIVLGCIILGKISFAILGLFFTVVGLNEFFLIYPIKEIKPLRFLAIASGIIIFLACFFYANHFIDSKFFLLSIILFFTFLIIEMFRNKPDPFGNVAVLILSLGYIALPISFMAFLVFPLKDGVYTPNLLITIFMLIWAFDTGAYLSGIAIGKHKMFPRLSPKKSWEGIAGGISLAVLAALVISHYYQPVNTIGMIILALLAALGSTFGDLAESMLKRSAGVKDSGKLLPGHGGLLDRIDSLLFVGPIIYVFLLFYR